MKKILLFKKTFSAILLILILPTMFLYGCAQDDAYTDETTEYEKQQKINEQKINEFKTRNTAIEYDSNAYRFSSEILDLYKDKTLYLNADIDDIFYNNGELFLTIGDSDETFVLKITPEQYSMICSAYTDNNDFFDFHIVFTIDSIEPILPTMRAFINSYAMLPDDIEMEYDYCDIYYEPRIIHGTLHDIMTILS